MTTTLLKFFVLEGQRHHSLPVWESLLAHANKIGVCGGSAFQAMAGFGRHHVLHESRFIELGGTQTVTVEFLVTDEEAHQILEWVTQEGIRLFYAQIPAKFGVINPDSTETAVAAGS